MKNFSFTGSKKIFFIFSAVCLVAGILCCTLLGFNWDVDFVGGTEITINIGKTVDRAVQQEIEDIVKPILNTKYSSAISTGNNSDQILIRANELSSEEREQVFSAVAKQYNLTQEDLLQVDNVSGAISANLRTSAIVATSIAVLLMLLYIAIRFEFLSAIAAVLCLVHDVFFVLVAYSILQIPVNSNVIAVALTILGYSINATIIIFDRIRENRKLAGKATFDEVVDKSVKQTVTRSLYTTITTLLTIGMVYILGVTSIRQFALPLIVGIVVGLYSSVCLSGNIWCVLKKAFGKKK